MYYNCVFQLTILIYLEYFSHLNIFKVHKQPGPRQTAAAPVSEPLQCNSDEPMEVTEPFSKEVAVQVGLILQALKLKYVLIL